MMHYYYYDCCYQAMASYLFIGIWDTLLRSHDGAPLLTLEERARQNFRAHAFDLFLLLPHSFHQARG